MQIASMHRSLTRYVAVASALLIGTGSLRAQPSPDARLARTKTAVGRIRAEDILRDVGYLASDANMGRRTPFPGLASPGYDSAAAYVGALPRRTRVKPMGDNGTYFQHYTVTRSTLDTTQVAGAIGEYAAHLGRRLSSFKNFLSGGVREANVIYVGKGVRRPKARCRSVRGIRRQGQVVACEWLAAVAAGARPASAPQSGGRQDRHRLSRPSTRWRGMAAHSASSPSPPIRRARCGRSRRSRGRTQSVSGRGVRAVPGAADILSSRRYANCWRVHRCRRKPCLTDSTKARHRVDLGAGKRVAHRLCRDDDRSAAIQRGGDAGRRGSQPQGRVDFARRAPRRRRAGTRACRATICRTSTTRPTTMPAAARATWRSCARWSRHRGRSARSCSSGIPVKRWALGYAHDCLRAVVGKTRAAREQRHDRHEAGRNNSPAVAELSAADTIYVTGPKLLSTRIESAPAERARRNFRSSSRTASTKTCSSQYYYPRTDAGPYLERGIPIMQFFNGEHPDYHRPSDEWRSSTFRRS